MTQRVSVINSNNTLLVNDYDLSKLSERQTEGTGGILFSDIVSKPEFNLTIGTGEVTAGKAVIKCIRTASQPISNEEFYILFESDNTETLAVTNGNKIYIEINDTLLQDPTQIEDVPPSTDYSLGIGIGEIKSTSNYPSHPNYIKLWEIDGSGVETDMRVYPQIDGEKVNMTSMKQNIKTEGDIESNTVKQTIYTAPVNNTDYTPKKYIDDSISDKTPVRQFGGDGSDGSISGALTITGSNDTYIIKNYTSFAPGANTVTITPTNCILHIKVSGDCDLTDTTFDFQGKGGQSTGGNGFANTDIGSDGQYAPISLVGGDGGTVPLFGNNLDFSVPLGIRSIACGAAGGLGGKNQLNNRGARGLGGGCIIVEVKRNIIFNNTTMTLSGTNGGDGPDDSGGGGGGGGGSLIVLYNGILTDTSKTIDISGGLGGSSLSAVGSNYAGSGGGGGSSCTNSGTKGGDAASSLSSSNGGDGGTGGDGSYYIGEINTLLVV